jgi:gliding motility-associated-like protein
MKHFFFFSFLLMSLVSQSQDYAGTDFRFAFMKNLNPTFNLPPTFDISIEAMEAAEVVVRFGAPENIGLGLPFEEQSISLNAGETGVLVFGPNTYYQEITGNADQLSFHASSSGNIRIHAFHNRIYFSEASAILPTSSLGSEYTVMSFMENDFSENSEVVMVGTQDNTSVQVTCTQNTAEAPAGTPFTIELDQGEVYTVLSDADISGSTITSNVPLAVFSGTAVSTVNNCGANSHLYEQLLPDVYWGNRYAFLPYENKGGDLVRFLAKEDNTEILTNCEELFVTLNAGEFADFILTDAALFSSDQDFLMGQFMTGAECSTPNTADPNMLLLTPLDRGNSSVQFQMDLAFDEQQPFDPFNPSPPAYFVNITMPTAATASLSYNGNNPNLTWQSFSSAPELSYAVLETSSFSELQNLNGNGAVFNAVAYAMADYDAYTWSLGANVDLIVSNENNSFTLGEDLTICEGNTVQLSSDNPNLVLEWSTGETSSSIDVNEAGVYTATLNENCSSSSDEIEVFFAPEPVSILPDELGICEGDLVDLSVENPNENWTYIWSNGDEGPNTQVSNTGTIELTTTNEFGCSSETSLSVQEGSLPEVNVPDLLSSCQGEVLELSISSNNAEAFWSASQTAELSANEGGEYAWFAQNACGTAEGNTTIVFEDCDCNIYIPNAFTPDDNGINERFQPIVDCELSFYQFMIYNRWGEVVFSSERPSEAWNGDSGSGYYSMDEIYIYHLVYQSANDIELKEIQGSLTLLR